MIENTHFCSILLVVDPGKHLEKKEGGPLVHAAAGLGSLVRKRLRNSVLGLTPGQNETLHVSQSPRWFYAVDFEKLGLEDRKGPSPPFPQNIGALG